MKTYTDNYECGHCDKDTKQKVEENGSGERDCRDRFTCLECGWTKIGMSGEWMQPYDEEMESAYQYCIDNDKSSEFMLEYIQDVCSVSLDCVIEFLQSKKMRVSDEKTN